MNTRNDNEITPVLFRSEKNGEILAVFPYLSWKNSHHVMMYAHLGQHCEGAWSYVTDETWPATPAISEPLKQELISAGYNLQVINLEEVDESKMYQL